MLKIQYSNYFNSIYIVSVITNLEMILTSIQEDVHRLDANTMPFYIRNLSIHWVGGHGREPGNNPLQISRDDYTLKTPNCMARCSGSRL